MLQGLDKQTDKMPFTVAWQNATIENQELRFINLLKYHLFLTKDLSDRVRIFLTRLSRYIYLEMLN